MSCDPTVSCAEGSTARLVTSVAEDPTLPTDWTLPATVGYEDMMCIALLAPRDEEDGGCRSV